MVNAQLGMNYELTQTLARMQQQITALSTQPVLTHASTGQDGGQGLSTDKNGLHLFNPAGTEVVTLSTLDGSATLGNTTITGNLSVPNGSISNAALANPASFGQVSVNTTNFALGTTAASIVSGTIAVPAGYSQANVMVAVTVGAVNMTATGDFLYCQASINGVAANEIFSYASGNQGSAWTGSTKTATLTGLSGGVITLAALGRSQNAAWSANTANRAFVEAVVTFLR